MPISKKILELEEILDYKMMDSGLLQVALTHSSYANESKGKFPNNERLEFLGDSILNLIVSEYLFQNYRNESEGNLTKLRASLVSENSLFAMAEAIDLGKYISLGKGEELSGGRKRPSILSDTFEALIAAIYLDGGIENAKIFVLKYVKIHLEKGLNSTIFRDFKTELQEILQSVSDKDIEYKILQEFGPDHDKNFVAQVFLGGNPIGSGSGKSKKEAEQRAAASALNDMQL